MLNKKNKQSNTKIDFVNVLPKELLKILDDLGVVLKKINKTITQDTISSIEYDFESIKKYLVKYSENNKEIFRKKLKPKGRVFLILSYNEPLMLSIVPILNALVAGNEVVVKPSGKCISFFKKIWLDSGLVDKFELPIKIIEKFNELEIKMVISQVDCVYFFGSFENAKKIYQTCAEFFVEFVPEVETADCKIFKIDKLDNNFLSKDCRETILQSFTHAGQICQRISGVFVHENNFPEYQKQIEVEFDKVVKQGMEKLIAKNFAVDETYQKKVLADICSSCPSRVIESTKYLPKIVIKPKISSDFVKNGYFYPVLWLIPFKNFDELCYCLNNRKFYLGLNIQSDNKAFVDSLIERTKFTRYTVNTNHTDIREGEGWGGRWPSGSDGYKNWIEHFSVSYNIIK